MVHKVKTGFIVFLKRYNTLYMHQSTHCLISESKMLVCPPEVEGSCSGVEGVEDRPRSDGSSWQFDSLGHTGLSSNRETYISGSFGSCFNFHALMDKNCILFIRPLTHESWKIHKKKPFKNCGHLGPWSAFIAKQKVGEKSSYFFIGFTSQVLDRRNMPDTMAPETPENIISKK